MIKIKTPHDNTKGGNQFFKFGFGKKRGGDQNFSKILGGATKALQTMLNYWEYDHEIFNRCQAPWGGVKSAKNLK